MLQAEALDMTIMPTISFNSIWTDGNHLQGQERTVTLYGGNAVWLKAGVGAKKKFAWGDLETGFWRRITLNDMPGMTLGDSWAVRKYTAEKADCYTASFGVSAKLTDNLSVEGEINGSFDGYFNKNAEGIVAVQYFF